MKLIRMYDKQTRTWTLEVEIKEQELLESGVFSQVLPMIEKGTDDIYSVVLLGELAKQLYRKRAKDSDSVI